MEGGILVTLLLQVTLYTGRLGHQKTEVIESLAWLCEMTDVINVKN